MRRIARLGLLVPAISFLTALYGPLTSSAGADDWLAPSGSVDVLSPAYVPAPGHGMSVSAICSGTDAVEVGLHPWDLVARNLQVYAADGTMLANVTQPEWFSTIPLSDHPARLVYNGGQTYTLVTDRCAMAPTTTVPVTVPPPTTTVPADVHLPPLVVKRDPATLDIAVEAAYVGAPAATPVALAKTGPSPEGLLLAAAALAIGVPLTVATHRAHKGTKR